ncbi:histidine phosphatase family protein [Amycolatopsis sp. CA-126428]|uniref:histidine phosphatase family protein n=1 Tax=Amycolatopsis sp. CA-126428 TaxID=2073158 RepID=UPI000CD079E4|nr:histidine phosphatase family protein [Amycolatopsis sp. CA-126428]
MTDVVLVRHGQSEWHADNRYAGRSDIDLTSTGRLQAQRLARWAATAGLSACFSSPLRRARQTLVPVCERTNLPERIDDRLRELDFGDGEGLTAGEMAHRLGERWTEFTRDPVGHHLPGGEDPVRAIERALAFLDDVADEYPNGRVLIIGHSTLIRLLLCRLMGIHLADYRRVFPTMRNVGLTEIRLTGNTGALLQFNGEPASMR